MRNGVIGWAAVLATLTLASCTAPEPMASVAPVAWSEPVSAADPNCHVVPGLTTLDPATVPRLQERSVDAGGAAVTLPQLAGAASFSAAVRDVVATWRAAGPTDAALTISWNVLAAADSIIGVGLHEQVTTDVLVRSKAMAVFADVATGEVWTGASLLRPETFDTLARLVRSAVQAAGLAYPFGQFEPALTPDDLDVVAITGSGALQIRVDRYVLGPRSTGEPVVEIDPTVTTDLLTDAGLRVRDAVVSGQPLALAHLDPPDCASQPCVALTFDDGPDVYALELISVLAALDAPATVFLQGDKTNAHPELAQAYAAAGVQLCGHAYSHRELTKMPLAEAASEFVATLDHLAAATGIRPNCQRPPYGSVNAEVASVSPTPLYLWDVDPRDWANKDAGITHANVMGAVAPGSIVLLHETHHSTVAALPAIVTDLRAAGYLLVTLDELMAGTEPQPGQLIKRR